VKLEWSVDALADLDRFERFLRDSHPHLAPVVAEAIIDAAQVLEQHPKLGRPLQGAASIAKWFWASFEHCRLNALLTCAFGNVALSTDVRRN